jgi:hypothetical protein
MTPLVAAAATILALTVPVHYLQQLGATPRRSSKCPKLRIVASFGIASSDVKHAN